MVLPLVLPVYLLIPIWILLGGGIGGLIGVIIGVLLPDKATSIAIFGSTGSGKSTLWQQLQRKFKQENYHPTLAAENINQFIIEYDGKKKKISKSKDFSGQHEMVKEYGEIIMEGTFIYYLIDLTSLNEYKKETRARIKAIYNVIKQKSLNDKVGIRFVATHFNEYLKLNPGKTISDAQTEIIYTLGLKNIDGVSIDEAVMVAELTEEKYIKQFFEQIVK